jgi:protein tyrosine phosphatase (PTP) superfamily phosphohydrolase (DUF442 family)
MRLQTWCGALALLAAAGAPPAASRVGPAARVEAPGLHNVYRLTDRLYSGSSPEGDAGFASLKRLGIKTVLSVDGARPDVARAHRYGLRYVHLPVGYDGVPQSQALRIARAVRDLPGPVYVHCHHGLHRGPAAAAVAWRCLDGKCPAAAAVMFLRQAGTDPRYTGLYAAAEKLRVPAKDDLDRMPADFPEAVAVPALAQAMVGLDRRWDNLKQVRAAGWQAPRDNPDLDPAHEALQLVEQYREAGRLPDVKRRPGEFSRWLGEAEAAAGELEAVLRRGKAQGTVDAAAAAAAFRRAGSACARCHGKYRDAPPP